VVGSRRDGTLVTARDIKADGAMAVLLRDALAPNLVQTLEGNPALVHGGPFANIAHGCNSLIATRLGLSLADVVVTEAGFGADLGGEKFCDIKARIGDLAPSVCVVVATVRALKMHGGVAKAALGSQDVAAVQRGVVNLARHVENMGKFGIPVVVALNRFTSDTDAEIAAVQAAMETLGTEAILCTHWSDGGAGAAGLAQAVLARIGQGRFAPLYEDGLDLPGKIGVIAREVYRAGSVAFAPTAETKLKRIAAQGFGHLPVCIAKTQSSFSSDPTLLGAPSGHVLTVRDVRLAAGAGFVVAICGEIMTMPGLPRHPAAESITLDADGQIQGLF
jgi:formate--tetrahydrofolate ligase